jgi:hypothetical protein
LANTDTYVRPLPTSRLISSTSGTSNSKHEMAKQAYSIKDLEVTRKTIGLGS